MFSRKGPRAVAAFVAVGVAILLGAERATAQCRSGPQFRSMSPMMPQSSMLTAMRHQLQYALLTLLQQQRQNLQLIALQQLQQQNAMLALQQLQQIQVQNPGVAAALAPQVAELRAVFGLPLR